MTRVRALLCVGTGVMVLLGWHLSDLGFRDAALARFLSDRNKGIVQIANDYGSSTEHCAIDQADDLSSLALAFLTVETFATPALESWARATTVRLATLLGVTPDISIGPGRIKPSTAWIALHDSSSRGADDYRSMTNPDLARQLLKPCGAIRIAVEILDSVRRQSRQPSSRIDMAFIRRAATSYNGQSGRAGSLEASLSSKIYFDLVYAAFQHYRFSQAVRLAE
jgi:hypothetical protein